MHRIALLTFALAVAGVSTAAFAQSGHDAAAGGRDGHAGMRDHARDHDRGHGLVQLDADQDGRIARTELGGDGRGAAMLAKQFAGIDANHDGYLVRAELQAWRQAHHAQRRQQRSERQAQRFAEADLNHDGKLSKVEASGTFPRLARHFAWNDDNRDGYLSREELRPMRGHHGR